MKFLGVDYGERKTGLAVSEGKLAEPLMVVRHEKVGELVEKLIILVREEGIEKIVVGVSEGKMGKKQKLFGRELEKKTGLPVLFQDETLSTMDAQRMSIEAGKGRKRRREMEDAYAATVTLQAWVDGQSGK